MGFAGYVSVCMQLYCVGFHCLSPHVSGYMAIFRSFCSEAESFKHVKIKYPVHLKMVIYIFEILAWCS
jgi:hypothetical protein